MAVPRKRLKKKLMSGSTINKTILRRFIVRKNHILLKPDNRSYQDIVISKDDEFKIIGKITDTK